MLDEQAISSIPLNGRRFTDLLLLTPGVTQDPRGLTSGSNGDLSYGGIRGYNTSYLVDGVDNNNGFFAQARGRYRSPYQFSDEVVARSHLDPCGDHRHGQVCVDRQKGRKNANASSRP